MRRVAHALVVNMRAVKQLATPRMFLIAIWYINCERSISVVITKPKETLVKYATRFSLRVKHVARHLRLLQSAKQAHTRSRYSMQAGFGIVPRFFAAGSSDLGHARLVFKTRIDPTLNNTGLISFETVQKSRIYLGT